MADLDADLYGDLYEAEFEEELAGQPPKSEPAAATMPATPTTADPRAHATSTKSSTASEPAPKPTPIQTAPVSAIPAPAPQPIATYESNTTTAPTYTQHIPTYEEPVNDYSAPRTGSAAGIGGFQNLNAQDRTVRPSEMKDEGKMFIGGLNWDTTDEGLKEYFEQFGKVDACTIMRDPQGRSRCFAFLTFEEPASVNAVMVREHYLDGKVIDPKRAIPRQEHQRATKLFIGGLAGTVTSESMREFFSQFGKVIDSTVMLDRETGRSKGFGFISFEDTDVQPFLGFGNLEIDGKVIDVKLAQPRYQRGEFGEDGAPGAGAAVGAGASAYGGAAGGAGRGAGGYNAGAQAFNPMAAAAGAGAGGAAFDPQALANLYTRMFQMASAGGAGGVNPMMMGGMGGGMMGGAPGGAPAAPAGYGRGNPMMGGMPRGGGQGGPPRGPRGQAGMGAGGAPGPQRTGRGQNNFHPYARGGAGGGQ